MIDAVTTSITSRTALPKRASTSRRLAVREAKRLNYPGECDILQTMAVWRESMELTDSLKSVLMDTIVNGEKQTLSDEMASEAASPLSHCLWQTYKCGDTGPFLHYLLEKPVEMSVSEPLFLAISSRCLLSVCFSPFTMVTPSCGLCSDVSTHGQTGLVSPLS